MKRNRKKANIFSALLLVCGLLVISPLLIIASSDGAKDGAQAGGEWDEEKFGPQERIHLVGEAESTYFDHASHTVDLGLECESCHDDLFEQEAGAAEANGDFNMKSFNEGKYCGSCHDGETAFHVYTQCDGCHYAPQEPIIFTKPVKAVIFDHEVHTDQGISCDDCHKELFKMNIADVEGQEDFIMESIYCDATEVKYCGVCHDGETAFPSTSRCNVCHIGVKGHNRMKPGDKEKRHGAEHH